MVIRLYKISACLAFAVFGLLLADRAACAAAAPEQTIKVVGGLATGNRYARIERPFWTTDLAKASGGRFAAEVVPFDRAGVPGQDLLRLMQIGVIPFGTVLFSHLAADVPELYAPDLAGLNPDLSELQNNLAAFKDFLERTLRERYGLELLSVYVYPAQVLFCRQAFTRLADVAGRRVRVASASAADFVNGLGGTPVITEFSEIMTYVRGGNVDCAVTGALSGNTIGLHEPMRFISAQPISWGLSVFVANGAAWRAMHPDFRSLLQTALPKLEQDIWRQAQHDSAEGLDCNRGLATCATGKKGSMVLVAPAGDDAIRRTQVLRSHVLPAWLRRCGTRCEDVWQQTVAKSSGISLAKRAP
ncbi:MAG: TRAP transporter substrate-binding protein [Burkholderiales bacterium]|nr:TRAP transporter substrate-binding protein [Burkholderiales bacterium]